MYAIYRKEPDKPGWIIVVDSTVSRSSFLRRVIPHTAKLGPTGGIVEEYVFPTVAAAQRFADKLNATRSTGA